MNEPTHPRLYRSSDRMIAGVAGGLAGYLDIDPTVARLLFVLALFMSGGTALLAYLVMWLVVPQSEAAGDSPRPASEDVGRSGGGTGSWLGIALVVLGVLLLLHELTILQLLDWGFARFSWPLLLIVAGGAMIVMRRDRTT